MIQSFCCLLIAIIARITVGVYESKFKFLAALKIPCLIAIIVLACVFLAMTVLTVFNAIRTRRNGNKDYYSGGGRR